MTVLAPTGGAVGGRGTQLVWARKLVWARCRLERESARLAEVAVGGSVIALLRDDPLGELTPPPRLDEALTPAPGVPGVHGGPAPAPLPAGEGEGWEAAGLHQPGRFSAGPPLTGEAAGRRVTVDLLPVAGSDVGRILASCLQAAIAPHGGMATPQAPVENGERPVDGARVSDGARRERSGSARLPARTTLESAHMPHSAADHAPRTVAGHQPSPDGHRLGVPSFDGEASPAGGLGEWGGPVGAAGGGAPVRVAADGAPVRVAADGAPVRPPVPTTPLAPGPAGHAAETRPSVRSGTTEPHRIGEPHPAGGRLHDPAVDDGATGGDRPRSPRPGGLSDLAARWAAGEATGAAAPSAPSSSSAVPGASPSEVVGRRMPAPGPPSGPFAVPPASEPFPPVSRTDDLADMVGALLACEVRRHGIEVLP